MIPEYSREFIGVFIRDFLVRTPNIANDMSVLIVSTRSSQWCDLFLSFEILLCGEISIILQKR
jgi:hypothetical protein